MDKQWEEVELAPVAVVPEPAAVVQAVAAGLVPVVVAAPELVPGPVVAAE